MTYLAWVKYDRACTRIWALYILLSVLVACPLIPLGLDKPLLAQMSENQVQS